MEAFGFLVIAGIAFIWFLVIRSFVDVIRQNRWNARQPVISTDARVVAKRLSVHGGGENTSASTSYYATFETPNGERREYSLPGKEYGLLAEGDRGTLSSQGTAYRSFVRQRARDTGTF